MTSFVPSVSKVLTVCMLWITAMFFSFCVYKWSAEQKRFLIFSAAFPALYLTAPCFAEQFYFTLQSFEVVFALFLCGAAVYGAGQLVFFRGGLLWGLISVLLMVWAFGTYQAMAAVAVTLTVILFMTVYLSDTGKGRGRSFWFLSGVRLALIFWAVSSDGFSGAPPVRGKRSLCGRYGALENRGSQTVHRVCEGRGAQSI